MNLIILVAVLAGTLVLAVILTALLYWVKVITEFGMGVVALWLILLLGGVLIGGRDPREWPQRSGRTGSRPPCSRKRGDADGCPGHSDSRGSYLLRTERIHRAARMGGRQPVKPPVLWSMQARPGV